MKLNRATRTSRGASSSSTTPRARHHHAPGRRDAVRAVRRRDSISGCVAPLTAGLLLRHWTPAGARSSGRDMSVARSALHHAIARYLSSTGSPAAPVPRRATSAPVACTASTRSRATGHNKHVLEVVDLTGRCRSSDGRRARATSRARSPTPKTVSTIAAGDKAVESSNRHVRSTLVRVVGDIGGLRACSR